MAATLTAEQEQVSYVYVLWSKQIMLILLLVINCFELWSFVLYYYLLTDHFLKGPPLEQVEI